MALTNRDRVGRAFEVLARGLQPYLERRIPGGGATTDPAGQLRTMTDRWEEAFGAELGRGDRNVVFELRDFRNRWAHNEAFSTDDVYRLLDSVERLLTAIDAREAGEIGQAKDEVMRVKYEAQARKATPSPEALLSQPAAGLRPWRDVIQPHDDVARGRFALAEFAADLHQVALGEGAAEYAEPAAFFARTFLTAGLRDLLGQAVERLAGHGGAPVVDLQTSFGGGKTHSMIALYHLFSGTPLGTLPQEVQDLVRSVGVEVMPEVRRAVLVGTQLKPGQASVKDDGTEVGTLWGELAWQLGGAEAFALVAESDRSRTNPGDALREVLRRSAPCLVLIDEWVAYARGLFTDDTLRGGTFDTHFSFAQALTEAARSVPGALLVVSIPASESPEGGPGIGSDIEVGGAGGREALRRLRVVVGRMESSWRPATAEESFEIVRRRLFQPVDNERMRDRDATAKTFRSFYEKQATEFPPECREASYEARLRQAYPIHPELFARLYEDWSTLDRFQRTRGVLRLMASVVHALWAGGDQSPLILPASVPLSDAAVAAELTRNLDDAWKPIIDADIDGERSLPRALDDQYKNLGRYLAVRRVARTVFLGSAPRAGSPNQGIDAARVRLGCAMPGESTAVFGDALSRLADRATYFYAGNGRYWYGTQPSVGRLARDRADRYLEGDRHQVHDAVVSRLQRYERERGDFAGVHVAPSGPDRVVDTPEARLVLLSLDTPHVHRSDASLALDRARMILDSRGNAPRDHRNMLVFLAAEQKNVTGVEQATADWLAWRSVVDDATALNLDAHQQEQARDRLVDAERTIELRVLDTWVWLLVPDQPEPTGPAQWDEVKVEGQGGLAARASARLVQSGGLYVQYPPVLLRLKLDGPLAPLWEGGTVSVGAVWSAYTRYLYLHRLRDISVLQTAVASASESTAWELEGFGVADAQEGDRLVGLRGWEGGGVVRDSSLLVRPEIALRQRAAERAPDEVGEQEQAGVTSIGPASKRRFYAIADLDPERLGRDAGRIAQEIVAHLIGLVDTAVTVTIEVSAVSEDGFDDQVMRTVNENASALQFRAHRFEER